MQRSDAPSSVYALSCTRPGVPDQRVPLGFWAVKPVLPQHVMLIRLNIDNIVGEVLLLLSLPHLRGPIDLLVLIL